MNLKDALAAVAPVVGDGKLIPAHAYVLVKTGVLHATDGRQWVRVGMSDDPPDFCVRYEPLRKALEREHTAMESDGDNGLIVRYGRGRARLRGIDPDSWPLLTMLSVEATWTMPSDFGRRIKDLMAFCADGDGHVWQQAVHLQDGGLFAANSFALAKYPTPRIFDGLIGIPTWACKFIANMEAPPNLRQRGQMISFSWPGTELFTTLLTQQAPDNIVTFASELAVPVDPVPDGLKEAVARIAGYGGKICKIGNGEITYGTDAVELVDGLDINGAAKTWGIETLSAALEHASLLNLSTTNASWAGGGYVGVFGGRTD